MDGKRKMRASTNGSYTDYMDDFDDQVRLKAQALPGPVASCVFQSNPITHNFLGTQRHEYMMKVRLPHSKPWVVFLWLSLNSPMSV